MYYEVKQVGDAAYPLAKYQHLVIPRMERLLFEQEVLRRPSALFKGKERMSYCLHDQFVPRDSQFADTFVELEGTPPFTLQISIKTASHVYHQTAEVTDKVWKIDLPSYSFNSIGPHHVTIESVQDASQCPRAPVDLWQRSIWVDVAETAAIVPIDRREHYCVGDVARFELEGTPPWAIRFVL
jgi:nucleoporin POM152